MIGRHWLLVIGVVGACLIVAVARHETGAKSYAATASVTFQTGTLSESALQVGATGGEPQREADTEALIAHSPEVARAVAQALSLHDSTSELLREVKVEVAPNADVLEITATTGSPLLSSRLANAFANQYIDFRTTSQLAGVGRSESTLRNQLATLPVGSPERATLQQSLERLTSLRAVAGSGASVIGTATPPSTPTGSSLSTTVVFGALIGLALAFALAFLLESLDRRLKSIEELEHEYGLPALAVIAQEGSAVHHRSDESGEVLEPYRILRSALDLAGETRLMEAVLITSAVSGEGKTTVAVNLAHAIALTGRSVALVELDLRRPSFASHFRLNSNKGFTTLFTGDEDVSDLLSTPIPELPNFTVLPAGRIPPNPSELLGSPHALEALSELSRNNDVVIIDAPPLNPVADAQVLLDNPAIQAVLMVARADLLTRDQAGRARKILELHAIKPVGLVATGVRDDTRYGYDSYAVPALQQERSPGVGDASSRAGLKQSSLTN